MPEAVSFERDLILTFASFWDNDLWCGVIFEIRKDERKEWCEM